MKNELTNLTMGRVVPRCTDAMVFINLIHAAGPTGAWIALAFINFWKKIFPNHANIETQIPF